MTIYQIPNSYSQLYFNENFANTFEKEVNKGTYNSNSNNNKENYFDNDSDKLKTDNFNDQNSYPDLDNNNKSTNNIISNQESLSKEDNENFNLKDYAKSLKQLYKKQINNQELDGENLYYNNNNNNNNNSSNEIKNDLTQSFEEKNS